MYRHAAIAILAALQLAAAAPAGAETGRGGELPSRQNHFSLPDEVRRALGEREHAKAVALLSALLPDGPEGRAAEPAEFLEVGTTFLRDESGSAGDAPLFPTIPSLPGPSGPVSLPPLWSYTNQAVTVAGDLYRVAPGLTVTLGQTFLSAQSSTITVGNEVLEVAGTLLSSITTPLAVLQASSLTGRNFVLVTGAGGQLTIAGPLLSQTGGTFTTTDDGVNVSGRGRLVSTGTGSLLSFSGASVNPGNGAGDQLFVVTGLGSSTTLAGGLVNLANSTTRIRGQAMFEVSGSAIFTDTATSPLVTTSGGSLRLDPGVFGFLANTSGTANLSGPLFQATNTNLTVTTDFVRGLGRGRFIITGSTAPVVALTGGTHSLSTGGSIFRLSGTATALDPVSGLVVGTEQPLQGGGVLFSATGATVTSQRGVRLDTVLLQRTLPALALVSSVMTTTSNTVDLTTRSKLTELASLMTLDASRLTVTAGSPVNVAGGSYLGVTGNLFDVTNASRLQVNAGPLLFASAGSRVSVSGALIAFGGAAGNVVSVTNTLCPGACPLISGIPVYLSGGAVAANVSITNPIKNAALGTVTTSSARTALIRVDGAATRVTIQGN
ncbi:MAG TPA: hypothetical protein VFN71_15085 [Methylomirabilota bacterium]|nr:hypothetical protein [Methylomirabilota bacterium]